MSATNEKLFAEFPPVTTAEWEAAIAKDLKGRDPKTLIWKTEDGVDVKPFYRAEDIQHLSAAEVPLAARSWHVGCEASTNDALRNALEHGAQAVIVPLALVKQVPIDEASVHVKARAGDAAAFARATTGSLHIDPIADLSREEAIEHFRQARATVPGMAPFVVDAVRFQNAAATVTQELAFAVATGAECLAELTEAGILASDATPQIIFSFGIGSSYFFEIAKLRAARLLWRRITEAFGATADARIHAHTSRWNKTIYDAHVNLLRATTEAMSAVIGGCEMLSVGPFDEVWKAPNEFSQRLAINTQLILRDEAQFGKSDAAAGSWYIEALTDQIARAAWKIFQDVEAVGGMRTASATGFVEQTIGAAGAKRDAAIATRKRIFVGVNQYANAAEEAPAAVIENGITNSRGAFPFEAMRLTTDRYALKTGSRPVVFLARLGDAKMRRARAEFVSNYFACAGFAIADSNGFDSADDAIAAIQISNPAIVVLCSSDAEYPALAAAICPKVSQPVIIAGYSKELLDTLKQAGVADFVYLGSNAVQVLTRWQKQLGIVS